MEISIVNRKPNHLKSFWKMGQRSHQDRAFQSSAPPESTSAETFYCVKQKDSKTPVVVRLLDGEEIGGLIEWYDKNCLKIRRLDGSGIVIMKHSIKCIFK
jgi:sRNA-binding regulator protein Hfq